MCNDYGHAVLYTQYVEAFSDLKIPLVFPQGAPNLEPREDIRPTNPAPVLLARDGEAEFATLRWGFAPSAPKRPPVINFRSEGRTFGKGRCLIPASHFFEFTGAKYPKTKWRFTKADEDWFCIAGLWRPEEGGRFTMLTCAPGPDVAPYHDRQIVVLERRDWARWLDPAATTDGLLQPLPAGSLRVEKVEREAPAPSLV